MNKLSIKRNLILNTAYQILTMITPFITAPYVSRVLGVDGVGIYSYTGSIQYYFTMLAALGTASYGTREIARNRNNKAQRSKLFWEIELLTVFTTLASLCIWCLILVASTNYRIYLLACTFNIIAVLFDISWFYAGLEHFEHTVLQNSIFKILGIIAIFAFVKDQSDVVGYILIMALTTCLGNLSMWLYLPKYVNKTEISKLDIKPHFKETIIYFIPTIATSIYTVLDKTLIGIITKSDSQNGYYEQATKIINMTKTICFVALNNVLGSRISFLFSEKKYEEVKQRIDQSIDYISFMGVGILFGLLGISADFVPWFFGKGYENVVFLLYILSPLSLIIGLSNCLGSQYYTPAGLRIQSAKYLIAGSVVNLILNLLLIPHFMSYGAAVATVIAESIISILYLANCNRYLTVQQIISHIWRKFIAGILMLFWINILKSFIEIPFIRMICGIFTGSIIYILILILLKDSFIKFAKILIINVLKKHSG